MQHYWKHLLMVLLMTGMTAATSFALPSDDISKARKLREKGEFKLAEALLNHTLGKDAKILSPEEKKQFAYEIDLMERIRQDFPQTKDELYGSINKSLKDFTREEFEKWLKEGRFESRTIDGTEYFAGTSVSNLYWRHPELESRRREPKDKKNYYKSLLENCREIKKAAAKEKKPFVLPHHFKLSMTVTIDEGAVPDGEMVRGWLPIPRTYPFQNDFKLLASSSPVKYLADENSSIRSAYLEQPANKTNRLQIAYEYTRYGIRFDLRPQDVRPYDTNAAVYRQFTRPGPHVMFTGKTKMLLQKIVGPETNPMLQAKAIYDWVADSLKYSFSLEYSTIPNISDYSIDKGYGDCGQQALVFITLCRQQGIPARWQSGWYTFPGSKNIHDWSEIYLEPYGWIPVDPEFGNAVVRYGRVALTPDEQRELHEFYFGGLDQYRMAANCDHNQALQPPKKTWRSDDVDFQRGELEYGNKNIYLDKYSYRMQIEQLSPKRDQSQW